MSLLIFWQNRSNQPTCGADALSIINDLLPRLNCFTFTDLTWMNQSPNEMIEYADEAAKELALESSVFVDRDGTTQLVGGASAYPVPADWVDTIHASVDPNVGVLVRLRPSSISEINALDPNYSQTQTPVPARYNHDAVPSNTFVYPAPDGSRSGTVWLVFNKFPQKISPEQTNIPVPKALSIFFTYRILQNARQRQSEAMMPEMAAHFKERADMLKKLITSYWGEAE